MRYVNEALKAELINSIRGAGYSPNPSDQNGRIAKLASVRAEHPEAKIVVIRDEFTGCRFARAKRNRDRCAKLGHNSTNRGGDGSNCYQVWARW